MFVFLGRSHSHLCALSILRTHQRFCAMAAPGSQISIQLRELLRQAKTDGTLGSVLADVFYTSQESDWDHVVPEECEDLQLPVSATTSKSAASYGMELPPGIANIESWGKTILQVGKHSKLGMTYQEVYSSTNPKLQGYVKWILSAVCRIDLTPQVKDWVRFVYVKSQQEGSPKKLCFEDSDVERVMKA